MANNNGFKLLVLLLVTLVGFSSAAKPQKEQRTLIGKAIDAEAEAQQRQRYDEKRGAQTTNPAQNGPRKLGRRPKNRVRKLMILMLVGLLCVCVC